MNITLLSIGLVLLYILVLILLGIIAYSGYSLAPWLPIHRKDVERVLQLAKLKDGDIFIELGSGTGLLSIRAGEVEGVDARGIELSPPLVWISRLRKLMYPKSTTRFVRGNLFKHTFSDASVVYVFGMPRTNERLVAKLKSELGPNTRIFSYTFKIEGLREIAHNKPTETSHSIYEYRIQ